MTTAVNLVYATDVNYLTPTLVSIVSALTHLTCHEKLKIHILDVGVPDLDYDQWKGKIAHIVRFSVDITRHKVDTSCLTSLRPWRGSYGAYARLLLPKVLSEEKWCLYCDGDTLFTDDPIKVTELYDDRFAVVGHIDGSWFQQGWYDQNGIPLNKDEYVCSGVLLMNLDWMRKHRMIDKCLWFFSTYPPPPYADQDAINYACKGHIKQLHGVTWGALSEMVDNSGVNPGCIHYAGRLPSRMLSIGMLDVCRLWFFYARSVCGLKFSELDPGASAMKYYLKVLIAQVFKFLIPFLRLVPCTKSLYSRIESQYLSTRTMIMLKEGGSYAVRDNS